jgi:protein-tyrosine phosphatase
MTLEMSKVARRLYVGSKPIPGPHEGIHVIVLAAKEHQPSAAWFPGSEVIHAPFDDDPRRPLHEEEIVTVFKAARRVVGHLQAGRRVLCTCAMGLNRSALVAALAMHEVFGTSADGIIYDIRRARSEHALTNPHFERLLRATIDAKRGA